jgi:tetratricopeptide (TPR) repeat protein
MNTTSNSELEDFERSKAPESFEISSPSNNSLLPFTNASLTRKEDRSVEIDWAELDSSSTAASSGKVLSDMEESVRRNTMRFPGSARAHANLGVALLKMGQTKEAFEELTTALEIDPENYLASLTLARLHLAEGRIKDAEDAYRKLLQFHPRDAAAEVGLSSVLIRTSRHDEAYVHLSNAVRIDKNDSSSRFLLGVVCLQKSDFRCALNEFRAASNLDPRNPDIYHAIGVAYTLQGEHLRAEKVFKTALALAPDSSATVINLARTLLEFKKTDQAIDILRGYLDTHPDDFGVRDQLGFAFLQAQRYSAARSQLIQILETAEEKLTPTEIARHRTNIAVTYMHERAFKKAEGELKSAIEVSPEMSHIPYDNLARVYALTERMQDAIGVLLAAVHYFPNNREIRSLLSIVYAQHEHYWDAIRQLEYLKAKGTLTDENYACLGDDYLEVDEVQRALEVLMEGYSRFPKSMVIINNLAYGLLIDGKTGQAKEVLESRPPKEEVSVELTATLGLLHLREGDYEGARRLYKRAGDMAAKSSRKELARRVRQKMHLELARYHVERGEYDTGLREIRAGLQEKLERRSFVKELEALAALIRARSEKPGDGRDVPRAIGQ